MKTLMTTLLVVLAVGLFAWGTTGTALAADKAKDMTSPSFTGYPPEYYGSMDTGKQGWEHSAPSDTGKGYPPDYSNTPAWTQNNASAPGANTHAQSPQSQPAKSMTP